MKVCPKCNNLNRDEAKFCSTCGENLGVQPSDTTKESSVQDNAAAGSNPADKPDIKPVAANQVKITSKSRPPANVFLIGAGIVVIIAVGFLLFKLFFSADPVSRLLKGLSKLAKMKEVTSITAIDINYEGDDESGEFLNYMSFNAEMAANIDNLLAQVTLELIYDKKTVTTLVAGINNEEVYVDLKDLYEDMFYQEMEELVPDYEDYVNDYKLIKRAIDEISFKFDNKKYIKIIKNVLGKDIKGSGNKVTLTLDSDTMTELMEELIDEAIDDEKLMEYVRKTGIDLIEELLKDKKKLKKIEAEELEKLLETLEDEDDFEDYYTDHLSMALQSLGYGIEFNIGNLEIIVQEMEMTFEFGASENIKSIDCFAVVDIDGEEVEILLTTEIKSGADFTKVNKKKAIAVADLMGDYEELDKIFDEVSGNLTEAIKKNKKLTENIEDLSGLDVEFFVEYIMFSVYNLLASGSAM